MEFYGYYFSRWHWHPDRVHYHSHKKKGACNTKTIVQDSKGNFIDNGTGGNKKSEWEECQEAL